MNITEEKIINYLLKKQGFFSRSNKLLTSNSNVIYQKTIVKDLKPKFPRIDESKVSKICKRLEKKEKIYRFSDGQKKQIYLTKNLLDSYLTQFFDDETINNLFEKYFTSCPECENKALLCKYEDKFLQICLNDGFISMKPINELKFYYIDIIKNKAVYDLCRFLDSLFSDNIRGYKCKISIGQEVFNNHKIVEHFQIIPEKINYPKSLISENAYYLDFSLRTRIMKNEPYKLIKIRN